LDHVYTTNCRLVESVEEADYIFGDHCPVIITLMCRNGNTLSTRQIRDWKNYSPEILLRELEKQSWSIDMNDVQDYNDELEQRIMTIVDKLVPFVTREIADNNFSESPSIAMLKQRKKNVYNNARRRNNAQLLKRSRYLGKEIRQKINLSRRTKIREKILKGG
jgi:hypothetical protein